MALSVEQLTREALSLPVASRARLAEELLQSVLEVGEGEVDDLWAAEMRRRLDDIHSGKVELIPGEQVLAEARKIVGR